MGEIEVVSQDLGRVVLNMVSNACYATDEKRRGGAAGYEPTLRIETQRADGRALIRIRDNGNGMPQEVIDKIFTRSSRPSRPTRAPDLACPCRTTSFASTAGRFASSPSLERTPR